MHLILSLHSLKKVFLLSFLSDIKKTVIINSSDLFRRQYVLHLIHNNSCVIKEKKKSNWESEQRSHMEMG